ncbi:hypothetical protein [Phycisphaera mikurensis]|uniref:Uncharacterized protein n=1 Tax=Phycisphaera mikurensis (strain NBRC 102666 / KCTC 22515 / FYK2301M01) TaxID=1142394 RepID=I0II93_PHYMF|nr:hypothetical protein [Phycisphaera mikurensis]MBB6442456.1 hypothetical protein [Phycisphaera mikurensis]BAM04981.1 hypothetical protein PSMK_28220 [Phycisphaera mikurensis NBRC 102666]
MRSRRPHLVLLPLLVAAATLAGCTLGPRRAATLRAPWAGERTLAVAPLLNESGSVHADGVRLADRLTERLNGAAGVTTVPVNRVLAAMERLGLAEVRTNEEAVALRDGLGVGGLVAGTITAFDPYDPPKLGLNLGAFYTAPATPAAPAPDTGTGTGTDADADREVWAVAPGAPDTRALARAARPTRAEVRAAGPAATPGPVAAISRVYNASNPGLQDRLARFARHRGTDYARSDTDARLHRISADLFAEFVAYEAAGELLAASPGR